jgi:hypothetical protein
VETSERSKQMNPVEVTLTVQPEDLAALHTCILIANPADGRPDPIEITKATALLNRLREALKNALTSGFTP